MPQCHKGAGRGSRRPVIAVDFDGTICEHAFPECGELKPGAKKVLDLLSKQFDIVISSCRTSKMFEHEGGKYVREMIRFLKEHEIPYSRIDGGDEGKIVADAYVDDKAIRFTTWASVLNHLGILPPPGFIDTSSA